MFRFHEIRARMPLKERQNKHMNQTIVRTAARRLTYLVSCTHRR
jgi:hypothetical protein